VEFCCEMRGKRMTVETRVCVGGNDGTVPVGICGRSR
jgi:hypothetical protein